MTRLPKTRAPLVALNAATKHALAPPQFLTAATSRSYPDFSGPPVANIRFASRGIERGSSTAGAPPDLLMALIWCANSAGSVGIAAASAIGAVTAAHSTATAAAVRLGRGIGASYGARRSIAQPPSRRRR